MRNILLASAIMVGLIGCGHGKGCRCVTCCPPARCASPPVDVQAAEEIEVRAPRQKVVVEVPPAAATCKAPAPPTAVCPPAPCLPPPQAPAVQAAPMMMPMPGYGQPTMTPVTTQVRERTAMGFMFDTIR